MHYSNLKKYNEKGQRLAIFAKQNDDILNIFVLTCSKKDHFIKDTARRVYENYETGIGMEDYHPQIFSVPHNGKPKYTFLKWCNDNYYRQFNKIIPFRGQLMKGNPIKLGASFGSGRYFVIKTLEK